MTPTRAGRIVWLAALLAAWVAMGATARADTAEARIAEQLGLWRLDEASETLADPTVVGALPETTRLYFEAALAFRRSDFKGAANRLEKVLKAAPDHADARVLLGRARLALGDDRGARKVLDVLADAYGDDRLKTGADLRALGESLQLNGYFKDANRAFREALAADRSDHVTRVAWAHLFAVKYNYREADRLVKEVLAAAGQSLTPAVVEARLMAARLALESDRAVAEARRIALAIVERHPEWLPAQTLLARLDLEDERPEDAIARLRTQVLLKAPDDPEALALLAAAAAVLDDDAAYAAAEKAALRLNKRNTRFYAVVAAQVERVHRYREAIVLAEKGLRLRGDDPDLLAIAATGHSRLGNDARARTLLEKAHKADPYHVKVFNLLSHFYDQVEKWFTWLKVDDMSLRVDRNEANLLGFVVPPLLREARQRLGTLYGVKPKAPLHIEIFPNPETFAIRSIGLPRLAAHGICFGHVITARSPSAGDFNWAEVLWHELAHVYHLQLSRNRVPRWFTEGLALLDSVDGRGAWEREMDPELFAALQGGRLRGIADFNLSFTQARNLNDILVAYYQAYQVLRFIRVRFGQERVVGMLTAWGRKMRTPKVVETVLGRDVATFDREFMVWLGDELAWVGRANPLQTQVSGDSAERLLETAGKPDADVATRAEAAAAAWAANRPQQALTLAEQIIATATDTTAPRALALAHHVRAAIRHRDQDADGARADLERVVALGFGGLETQLRLAGLARVRGDHGTAAAYLDKAVELAPKDAGVWLQLADARQQAGATDAAFAARARAVAIDQADHRNTLMLLEAAVEHGAAAAQVEAWAEQLLFIRPFDLRVHTVIARTATAMGLKALAERAHGAAAQLRSP